MKNEYSIQLEEIDYPYYYGRIDGKPWGASFIMYAGRVNFKVLPGYDDLNKNERMAISRFLYAEAEIANRVPIRESKNRRSIKGFFPEFSKKKQNKKRKVQENKGWDKFVKDLDKRQRQNLKDTKEKRIDENSPQREYNKRYREDWKNSTRWTR